MMPQGVREQSGGSRIHTFTDGQILMRFALVDQFEDLLCPVNGLILQIPQEVKVSGEYQPAKSKGAPVDCVFFARGLGL